MRVVGRGGFFDDRGFRLVGENSDCKVKHDQGPTPKGHVKKTQKSEDRRQQTHTTDSREHVFRPVKHKAE
jgi:hypothetical protein